MGCIDYNKLYELQDKVLDIVFTTEDEFYLTGGTALSRFYHEKRYSDDLDFFANNSNRFNLAVKKIKIILEDNFTIKVEVESKDFIRFLVDDLLQVDFVNDRVFRYNEPKVLENGYKIDNIENILSNKLTAVVGRDNPKDIFDIYLISKFYDFNWNEILEIAHKKAGFSSEDLIARLKTFPVFLLNNINLVDKSFLNNFEDEYKLIIDEIKEYSIHKKDN